MDDGSLLQLKNLKNVLVQYTKRQTRSNIFKLRWKFDLLAGVFKQSSIITAYLLQPG